MNPRKELRAIFLGAKVVAAGIAFCLAVMSPFAAVGLVSSGYVFLGVSIGILDVVGVCWMVGSAIYDLEGNRGR